MSLKDYQPHRQEIKHRNKTLVTVRGLSMEDVSFLVRGHLDGFRQVFGLIDKAYRKLLPSSHELENSVFTLVSECPDMCAKLIAIASDEPEEQATARILPAPLQAHIIMEVMALTFEDVGGPLAFVGMVRRAVLSEPLPTKNPGTAQ